MQILASVPKNYNLLVKDENVLSSRHSKPILLYWNQLQWSVSFPLQESNYNNILKMVILYIIYCGSNLYKNYLWKKTQWKEMVIKSVGFISLNLTEFNK